MDLPLSHCSFAKAVEIAAEAMTQVAADMSSPETPPSKIAIENMGYIKVQAKQTELKEDLHSLDPASYHGIVP